MNKLCKAAVILSALFLLLIALLTYWAWFSVSSGLSAQEEPSTAEYCWRYAEEGRHACRGQEYGKSRALQRSLLARDHGSFCRTLRILSWIRRQRSNRGWPRTLSKTAGSEKRTRTDTKRRRAFFIISNGIRLSGMPAFGQLDTEEEIWKLVHFVRGGAGRDGKHSCPRRQKASALRIERRSN